MPQKRPAAVDAPISAAARLLVEQKIGGLPIVQDGRLVGIITASDLLESLMEPDAG